MTTYGQQLRAARLARGLSQSEVARRIHVTPQHLCDIEHDDRKPSTDVAKRLEALLGVPAQTWQARAERAEAEVARLQRLLSSRTEVRFMDEVAG